MPVIYNDLNIQAWQIEVPTLRAQKQEHNLQISSKSHSVHVFNKNGIMSKFKAS